MMEILDPPLAPARTSKTAVTLWILATVIVPLLMYFAFSSVYIGAWYARTHHQGQPPAWLIVRSMFYCLPPAYWITIAIWFLSYRRRASFGEMFMIRSRNPLVDIVLGLALGAIWVLIYGTGHVVEFGQMFTFDHEKLLSAPTSISAGFVEEFLFRGFLIFLVTRAGGGRVAKLLISALAFGLAHILWGPVGMFWTFILGLSFAGVTLLRGNVWAAVIAHTVLDLCIEPALIQKAMAYAQH